MNVNLYNVSFILWKFHWYKDECVLESQKTQLGFLRIGVWKQQGQRWRRKYHQLICFIMLKYIFFVQNMEYGVLIVSIDWYHSVVCGSWFQKPYIIKCFLSFFFLFWFDHSLWVYMRRLKVTKSFQIKS